MKNRRHLFHFYSSLLILILCLFQGCDTLRDTTLLQNIRNSINSANTNAKLQNALPERFPLRDRFLGADAAFSVAITPLDTVWFMGDTFWGDSDRTHSVLLSNSLVRAKYETDHHTFSFAQRPDLGSNGFFNAPQNISGVPDRNRLALWPKAGIMVGKTLWVAMSLVHRGTSGPWDFKVFGLDWVEVKNPSDPSNKWQMKWHESIRSETLSPASALALDGNYIYSLVAYSTPDKSSRTGLSRTSVLTFPNGAEYLYSDGSWGTEPLVENFRPILNEAHNEMSLSKKINSTTKQSYWVTVYSGHFLQDPGLYMQKSKGLEGPWSEAVEIYRFPEADKNGTRFLQGAFCYAGKEHPQFSTEDTLVATYVCNGDKVLENNDLYVPTFTKVKNFQKFLR